MRKPQIVTRPYKFSATHKWVVDLRAFGKARKFFKTRADADAEASRQRTLLERHSRAAVGLSPREMHDFIDARERLSKFGKTIREAADFLIDHQERVLKHGTTVSELAEKVLELKRKANKSGVHLNGLKMYFRTFCDSFGNRPIASITTEELDDWLSALPANRAKYRSHISVLFGVAKKRKIVTANPISDTETPKKNSEPPEVFTVEELQALLEAAQRTQPDILPLVAIGAFAGLRSDVKDSEIARLDWSEVNQQRGFIEVKARKAKSAQRRLVPIQPNLAEWLRPYASVTGPVLPKGARRKLEAVRKASGVTWKNNGLRHSFASYRLAASNDAPKVATELGHPSPTLLYSTYRELVHPDEAASYWQITPPKDETVVPFVKQKAV
jgi:integrase